MEKKYSERKIVFPENRIIRDPVLLVHSDKYLLHFFFRSHSLLWARLGTFVFPIHIFPVNSDANAKNLPKDKWELHITLMGFYMSYSPLRQ
jgi:hypothetical protein